MSTQAYFIIITINGKGTTVVVLIEYITLYNDRGNKERDRTLRKNSYVFRNTVSI